MNTFLVVLLSLLTLVVVVIGAHFFVIEAGREVVTLRTRASDGTLTETRLWVVDHNGQPWLHSAGRDWERRFEANPQVELVRNGNVDHYIAEPDRSEHAAIDAALRQKYGLADRWVRFLAPCDDSVLPVRLRRVADDPGGSSQVARHCHFRDFVQGVAIRRYHAELNCILKKRRFSAHHSEAPGIRHISEASASQPA